jgi:transcription initiation factor TFIIIB Brf1 subunit/transcription initiation factor TFIIB
MESDGHEEIWDTFFSQISLNNNPHENGKKHCKSCSAHFDEFVTTNGDIICTGCGTIQEERIISEEAEWNNYTEDGVVNSSGMRCGNVLDPTNPYDTAGDYIPKFHWSWHLDENGVKRYTNLSKLAIRASYTSKQRAFDEGKYSFEHIQNRLNLSDPVFNAAKLYWGLLLKSDILKRGGNRRGMKACCVFYACMSERQQRNREDIAAAFDIDGSTDFTKGEKIFREIFEKDQKYSWVIYRNAENESMYQRYVYQLNLPYSIVKTMNMIKENVRDHLLGIAAKSEIAGLLYYACKEVHSLKHPNKFEIAKCIGICNPTLNKVVEILIYFYQKNPDLKNNLISVSVK